MSNLARYSLKANYTNVFSFQAARIWKQMNHLPVTSAWDIAKAKMMDVPLNVKAEKRKAAARRKQAF